MKASTPSSASNIRKIAITPKQAKAYGLFSNLAVGSFWRNKSKHVAQVEGNYKVVSKGLDYVVWICNKDNQKTRLIAEYFFDGCELVQPARKTPRAK